MILKLYSDDGEQVLFAGFVPNDRVTIHRPPNAPGWVEFHGIVRDALAQLETRVVEEPKPLPDDYWETAQ